ncbi:MAG: serine hydrolase domain-containing protein, partial [Terriglobales bacterium]
MTPAFKRARIKVSRSCVWSVLIAVLLPHGAFAAEPPSVAEVAKQAQQLLVDATTPDGPGAAILVARGDQVIFRGARGMAQMELGVPLRADDVFPIGSDTKQFAAAAILKLVEQGKLSLTDPLSRFLPKYPNGSHITVHELLNHTSGIKNYTAIQGYMRATVREDLDTRQLIAEFKDQPSDFPPGTGWEYNNSDYVLIGAILEKVTGKPWHEAIRELVLAPLALNHTEYGADQPLIPGRVAGYSTDENDRISNADYISMTQPGAGGGLVSNVDDMFH